MTYNSSFNELQAISDPLGHSLSFSYDPTDGNLQTISYPDGSSQQYAYDATGQVTQFINRDGQPIGYSYNSNGLLASESFPDGTQDTFSYDSHQNLVSMTDSTGTSEFNYDSADRLIKVTYPNGEFLTYAYNTLGQRSQMQDQAGFTVNYQYDVLGRLSQAERRQRRPHRFVHLQCGRRAGPARPSATARRTDVHVRCRRQRAARIVNLGAGRLDPVEGLYVYTYDNRNLPVMMTTFGWNVHLWI